MNTENDLLLDASAIASYLLNEEGSDEIHMVMRRSISEGGRVMTIPLAFKEVANALWRACTQRRLVNEETAVRALNDLYKLPFELKEQDKELVERSMRISLDSKLPVYDTLYIAAAEKEHSTLVTVDRRQYAEAVRHISAKLMSSPEK